VLEAQEFIRSEKKMIECDTHGEVEELTLAEKHYCPACLTETCLDNRIKTYELVS